MKAAFDGSDHTAGIGGELGAALFNDFGIAHTVGGLFGGAGGGDPELFSDLLSLQQFGKAGDFPDGEVGAAQADKVNLLAGGDGQGPRGLVNLFGMDGEGLFRGAQRGGLGGDALHVEQSVAAVGGEAGTEGFEAAQRKLPGCR